MTIIDSFSSEEFKALVFSSVSMRELEKKLGYAGNGSNGDAIRRRCEKEGISLEHFTGVGRKSIRRTEDNIFIKDSTASQAVLRRWYLKGNYTDYKCAICGQEPFWNEKELTLTLDHINGINNDDRLENLRWVCPNCDRQLETFCSKNPNRKQNYNSKRKNYCIDCGKEIDISSTRCIDCYAKTQRKVERPEPDQLESDIKALGFAGTGRKYGVSDNTIRKWCKAYNMPTKIGNYK